MNIGFEFEPAVQNRDIAEALDLGSWKRQSLSAVKMGQEIDD